MARFPVEFEELFSHAAPGLLLDSWEDAGFPSMALPFRHSGRPGTSSTDLKRLTKLGDATSQLRAFHGRWNGADLFVRPDPLERATLRPLLRLFPVRDIEAQTALYRPGGEWEWIIKHNAWRRAREGFPVQKWLVFGQGEGPSTALLLFLEGEFAGQVFHVAPEARRNVALPVYPSVFALLSALGRMPAKVLHQLGQTIRLVGRNGEAYGLSPLDYVKDVRKHPDYSEAGPFARRR